MLFKILKKDIFKRKGVNLILFVFIILATVFLTSSINNIIIITKSLDYYMDKANVPGLNIITSSDKDKLEIDEWLKIQKEKNNIINYDYNKFISISSKSIEIKKGNVLSQLDNKGASVYLAKMDVPYNKVFDLDGKSFDLKSGEIAVTNLVAKNNNLKIGDKIKLKVDKTDKEFEIKKIMKDAAFGSEMIGMVRFVISEQDYDSLENIDQTVGLYYVDANDISLISQEICNEPFQSITNMVTKDNYKMVYTFDMLFAALLILVGICLIFISMLVLRFTLTFTMEEEYQEIGILKAIGLKNYSIKKIYLIKYFVIVFIGSLIGFILSFPISNLMLKLVSENMLMQSVNDNYITNILCTIFIVIIVLLFCYLCTKKLNKISVISAIKGGETGESFGSKKRISLVKHKYMSVPFYLGLNDIFCHLRRFTVLIITFSVSFILITIPLNTVNTMKSNEMNKKFLIDSESSVYVKNIEQEGDKKFTSVLEFERTMNTLKEKLYEKGYDTKLTGSTINFFNYISENSSQSLLTIQLVGDNLHYLDYSKGNEPLLENEIAFSEVIMKQNNWRIGDCVNVQIGGINKTFLITGEYSDYMNLGKSARLNPVIRLENNSPFEYWNVAVGIDSNLSSDELVANFKKEFPTYEWMSGQEVVNLNIGGIEETMSNFILPVTLMLTLVIMLITLLMEKLFIARERGEIGMLKSIGFKYSSIRNFHIFRMSLVAICSMILAVPLSLLSNTFLLKPIFAIMGANVSIQIQPLEVYLLYPAILLIGIIIATVIASRDIKKISISEMKTME